MTTNSDDEDEKEPANRLDGDHLAEFKQHLQETAEKSEISSPSTSRDLLLLAVLVQDGRRISEIQKISAEDESDLRRMKASLRALENASHAQRTDPQDPEQKSEAGDVRRNETGSDDPRYKAAKGKSRKSCGRPVDESYQDPAERYAEFDDALVREFLAVQESKVSESRHEFDKETFRRYLPFLDWMRRAVTEATRQDVEAFAEVLAKRGLPRAEINRRLSTISKLHRYLNKHHELGLPSVKGIRLAGIQEGQND